MCNRLKGRIKKVAASLGIVILPNFERMTQSQKDAWFKNTTDEDMKQVYKEVMVIVRGYKPWEVEDMHTLTFEELKANLRQGAVVIDSI
jgi:hypothetical protein